MEEADTESCILKNFIKKPFVIIRASFKYNGSG